MEIKYVPKNKVIYKLIRINRVTKLRKKLGSELTIDAIKSFTGIRRDTTIQNYGLKTKADIHKIAKMLE